MPVTIRTGSSDCCPDYFTHCEGLSDNTRHTKEDKDFTRQTQDNLEPETVLLKLPMYSEQIGPEPATMYGHHEEDYYNYDYGPESADTWYQYQDNYQAQVGSAAAVQGPPDDCAHGVLHVSGEPALHFSLVIYLFH